MIITNEAKHFQNHLQMTCTIQALQTTASHITIPNHLFDVGCFVYYSIYRIEFMRKIIHLTLACTLTGTANILKESAKRRATKQNKTTHKLCN